MIPVRSRSTLIAAMVLLCGLLPACVSTGSSEPCIDGVEYEGEIYREQSVRSEWADPVLGTAVQRFCAEDNGAQEEAPDSFDAYRLGEVDPKYAILLVDSDGAGAKDPVGAVFSISQDEIPADVWAEIQSMNQ